MVGHDLRNPLSGIKNAVFLLKRKREFSNLQSEQMLDTIDRCVEHSNKIINDLWEYSREIKLDRQIISLKPAVMDALAMLEIPDKIVVNVSVDEESVVNADLEKIVRVFVNLIKNAIDALPNGGTISVDSKQVDDRLEISVADTGDGVPDDVLPKCSRRLLRKHRVWALGWLSVNASLKRMRSIATVEVKDNIQGDTTY
jgi:signal transduction histidine kinase